MGHFAYFCFTNNLPHNITSIDENKGISPGRMFSTHKNGRAADYSIRGWKKKDIYNALNYFNNKFKEICAISASDNNQRCLVYHKADCFNCRWHLHLQVKE